MTLSILPSIVRLKCLMILQIGHHNILINNDYNALGIGADGPYWTIDLANIKSDTKSLLAVVIPVDCSKVNVQPSLIAEWEKNPPQCENDVSEIPGLNETVGNGTLPQ